METWRPVPDFEDEYEISSAGNIRTKTRMHWNGYKHHLVQGIPKKLKLLPSGYITVGLSKSGKTYYRSVHRLVARTFLEKKDGKEEVNHKNFVRSDNRVENLEWCCRSENMLHTYKNGRHPNAIFSKEEIAEAERILEGGGRYCDVRKAIGCSEGYVALIKAKSVRRFN